MSCAPDIPVFHQYENDVLDYSVDWATNFLGSDTISTSTWIVPLGISQEGDDVLNLSGITTIWLTGGTRTHSYSIINRIVTEAGRTKDAVIRLIIDRAPNSSSGSSGSSGGIDGGTP